MIEQSFMPYLIAFGWIAAMMLLGTLIRAKVRFFQKYLVPSSLIGGLIGFVLVSLGWVGIPEVGKGWTSIPPAPFGLIAFHLFSFGFVAIGLSSGAASESGRKKEIFSGSLWMALLWSAVGCFQAIIGWAVFSGYNGVSGGGIFAPLGFLVGHGFAQGPGQVLAIGSVWETKMNISGAMSVGLTFAAVGFFVAAFLGVPLAYWGIKRGYAANAPKELSNDVLTGLMDPSSNVSLGRHTTHPGNMDTFAFHLALMGLAYLLGYLFCFVLKIVFPPTLGAVTFGFIFFWGMIIAVFLRVLLNKTGVNRYFDDDVQRRLTGTTVDFMIVSVMMAVEIKTVWAYFTPIAVTVVLATILTFILVLYFGRRAPHYGFEKMVAMFGYLTGTGASGLLLLRIVDPDFKTPTAIEIGLMNFFALFTFTHTVFMVTLAPAPGFPTIGQMVMVYAITGVVCVVLMKVFRVWKAKQF